MDKPVIAMFGEIDLPDGTRHIFLAEPARNLWKESKMRYTAEFQPIIRGNVPPPLTFAEQRHRDGMSCVNPAAYTYDANGHRRWCSDCGAELGQNAHVADPVFALQAQARLVGAAIAFVALVLLLAFAAWLTPSSAPPSGPVQVPTTYGYPSYGQVPDPGVRPPSVPVVR